MDEIAYIVVGWNNIDLLEECFDSIQAQDYPKKHIIYIDNDSKDKSVELVSTKYPGVQIIQNETNQGFAIANNIGIKEALQRPGLGFVALINSDATLHKSWTSEIVAFAKGKPKAALLQGTTLDYYNHNIIDSTHIYVSRNGQGTQGNWRYYYTQEFGPKKVFGVNAAACVITRQFIEAQPFGYQVFDEKMFMYLEDVDLVTRATVMGWDNFLVPRARAYHMGSASSGKNPGFSLFMTFRNNSGMLIKNFPFRILVKILPKLMRGDIETIKTLRRTGRGDMVGKIIKGRFIGLLRAPHYLIKRIKLGRHRRISNSDLWDIMHKGY